jgi:uncharacterized protein involved in type VI secretion and phage assembly
VIVAVKNPPAPGQVQLRLFNCDGPEGQDAPIWARVAMPLAGNQRGMFMLPDIGDEVLVTFIGGDSRFPVVVGSLWNGQHPPTETIGERGVDRWSFRSKDGTKISILESKVGTATLKLEVPGGVSATLIQSDGGALELKAAGSTITIDTNGVTIKSTGKVQVKGTEIELKAGQVNVRSAVSTFHGTISARAVIATQIVGTMYTPGAGNML